MLLWREESGVLYCGRALGVLKCLLVLSSWVVTLGKFSRCKPPCWRQQVVVDWCLHVLSSGKTVGHLLPHCFGAKEFCSLALLLSGIQKFNASKGG